MDILKLQDAVALSLSVHGWGNRATADKTKIVTKSDKELLTMTKQLIDSPEWKKIMQTLYAAKWYINDRSVPAFFKKGIWFIASSKTAEFENELIDRQKVVDKMVEDEFIPVYKKRIEEIKIRLADQFDASDYPSVSYLKGCFRLEWHWITFDVPKNLSKELFEKEKERTEKMWSEAAEKIVQSLRASFMELVKHASDALTVGSNGKTKAFKDSTFDNITEFINTFKYRNITNDTDLKNLVDKAEEILKSVDNPQELKKDDKLRSFVKSNFTEITKKLDNMIVEKPSRKFSFDE